MVRLELTWLSILSIALQEDQSQHQLAQYTKENNLQMLSTGKYSTKFGGKWMIRIFVGKKGRQLFKRIWQYHLIVFQIVMEIVQIYNKRSISISMDQIYKPKSCAFHPKELIVNFCKNPECLLPLCPSCINIHTEEHRTEQTYGHFENINKAVGDVHAFFETTGKQLGNFCEEISEQRVQSVKDQEGVKKRIQEAKAKMLTIVQRFFTDFEKEVTKSMLCYNESMKENYGKVNEQIAAIKAELAEKSQWLGNDKVLKALIGFHAKKEEERYNGQLQALHSRIEYLETQKVDVVCEPAAIQAVVEQMGNYIHLSFQNWQNEIKYVAEFVKTGFMSTGEGFNVVKT